MIGPEPGEARGRPALVTLGLAFSAFIVLGMADSGLGVAWPSMREFLGRGLSDLGLLLAALSIGYLSAGALFGRLERRLGLAPLLVSGAALLAVSAIGLAAGGQWAVVFAASAVMGLGAGLVDVGMNAHAALEFDRGSINNLHAAYGVGATLGPVLLSASLAAGFAWRGGYAALAGLQLVVAAAIWSGRSRWATRDRVAEDRRTSGTRPGWRVIGMLAVFLVYTGAEVATGQWSFSLLRLERGMSAGTAGLLVAFYWGGLTVGRLVFGWVGERMAASRVIDASIGIALGGLGLLWWDPGGLGFVGLPVAGIGFAAVFPTMVALTPMRIGRLESTRMIGYQLAAANVGAATLPWLLGLVAATAGLGWLPPGFLAVTLLLGALHLWVDRGRGVLAR